MHLLKNIILSLYLFIFGFSANAAELKFNAPETPSKHNRMMSIPEPVGASQGHKESSYKEWWDSHVPAIRDSLKSTVEKTLENQRNVLSDLLKEDNRDYLPLKNIQELYIDIVESPLSPIIFPIFIQFHLARFLEVALAQEPQGLYRYLAVRYACKENLRPMFLHGVVNDEFRREVIRVPRDTPSLFQLAVRLQERDYMYALILYKKVIGNINEKSEIRQMARLNIIKTLENFQNRNNSLSLADVSFLRPYISRRGLEACSELALASWIQEWCEDIINNPEGISENNLSEAKAKKAKMDQLLKKEPEGRKKPQNSEVTIPPQDQFTFEDIRRFFNNFTGFRVSFWEGY